MVLWNLLINQNCRFTVSKALKISWKCHLKRGLCLGNLFSTSHCQRHNFILILFHQSIIISDLYPIDHREEWWEKHEMAGCHDAVTRILMCKTCDLSHPIRSNWWINDITVGFYEVSTYQCQGMQNITYCYVISLGFHLRNKHMIYPLMSISVYNGETKHFSMYQKQNQT